MERDVETYLEVHRVYNVLFRRERILFAFGGGDEFANRREMWLISGYVTDFWVSGINRWWYSVSIYMKMIELRGIFSLRVPNERVYSILEG